MTITVQLCTHTAAGRLRARSSRPAATSVRAPPVSLPLGTFLAVGLPTLVPAVGRVSEPPARILQTGPGTAGTAASGLQWHFIDPWSRLRPLQRPTWSWLRPTPVYAATRTQHTPPSHMPSSCCSPGHRPAAGGANRALGAGPRVLLTYYLHTHLISLSVHGPIGEANSSSARR